MAEPSHGPFTEVTNIDLFLKKKLLITVYNVTGLSYFATEQTCVMVWKKYIFKCL